METGLYNKKEVLNADGSCIEKEERFFVMKIDSSDIVHYSACLASMGTYSAFIREHSPELAASIDILLREENKKIEKEESKKCSIQAVANMIPGGAEILWDERIVQSYMYESCGEPTHEDWKEYESPLDAIFRLYNRLKKHEEK